MLRKLDIVEKLEAYWNSPRYFALDNQLACDACVIETQIRRRVTEQELQHMHDRLCAYIGMRIEDDAKFKVWLNNFDKKMWPLLKEKTQQYPGLYKFYMEYANYSEAVLMFDYDAWTNDFATACLLAHGITHDFDGKLRAIAMDDVMLTFIKENACLAFMRYRAQKMQAEMRNVKEVCFLGGGADPAIFTRGYPVGENGQHIVIYDMNDMSDKLSQILEGPLEQFNIDYRVGSFMPAFQDRTQWGRYGLICLSGVMSYYPEKKIDILKGASLLLKPGGLILYDDILMHPDMPFCMKVRAWTVALKPEASLEKAISINEQSIPAAGLVYEKHEHDMVRGVPNVVVNWARKPVN